MQLTNEQKRIRIAEACGWKCVSDSRKYLQGINGFHPEYDGSLNDNANKVPIPDYLNDLNAMHEAEKVLDGSQIDEYKHRLKIVVTDKERISQCATATQRAEAFGRTLNLW